MTRQDEFLNERVSNGDAYQLQATRYGGFQQCSLQVPNLAQRHARVNVGMHFSKTLIQLPLDLILTGIVNDGGYVAGKIDNSLVPPSGQLGVIQEERIIMFRDTATLI